MRQTSRSRSRDIGLALISGAAGAAALTAVHQAARDSIPHAPRMDVLGMRALARGSRHAGMRPPSGRRLYETTLAGDLVANSLYYALVAKSRHPMRAGLALGAAAGVGAVLLPPVLGLGRAPHADAPSNWAMTVAWYTIGGLVAGAVQQAIGAGRRC
jgi:hypothetical protein